MWKSDKGGYIVSFKTSTGKQASTWFSNPPKSIDHVDKSYLQGRLWNVTRESQVKFIKQRFKQETVRLGIAE
jgi:hypothetical protein